MSKEDFMQNGKNMSEVKKGAGLGLAAVVLPLMWVIGKITGSVLRIFVLGAGIAFLLGMGAYIASRNEAPDDGE